VTDAKPEPEPYTLVTTPTVRRALGEKIPATVAFAAYEFMTGDLLKNPQRVGGELQDRSRIADQLAAVLIESCTESMTRNERSLCWMLVIAETYRRIDV
jgi:hypothetical protein